jgi:hypothetical protein
MRSPSHFSPIPISIDFFLRETVCIYEFGFGMELLESVSLQEIGLDAQRSRIAVIKIMAISKALNGHAPIQGFLSFCGIASSPGWPT